MRTRNLFLICICFVSITSYSMENTQFSSEEYELYKDARAFAKLCVSTYKQFPKTVLFRDKKVQTVAKSLQGGWVYDDMQPITALVKLNLDKDINPMGSIYTPWGDWFFADFCFYGHRIEDNLKAFKQIQQRIKYKKYECKFTNELKITEIDGKAVNELERLMQPLHKKAKETMLDVKEILLKKEENWVRWKAMTQQYKFDKSSLKKLCLKFICKNKEQFESNLALLPLDLKELIEAKSK